MTLAILMTGLLVWIAAMAAGLVSIALDILEIMEHRKERGEMKILMLFGLSFLLLSCHSEPPQTKPQPDGVTIHGGQWDVTLDDTFQVIEPGHDSTITLPANICDGVNPLPAGTNFTLEFDERGNIVNLPDSLSEKALLCLMVTPYLIKSEPKERSHEKR